MKEIKIIALAKDRRHRHITANLLEIRITGTIHYLLKVPIKEHMGLGTVETYSVSSHEPTISPSLSGVTRSEMHSLTAFSTSPSL